MGEVHKAHDERLDRDVAVKVLPEAVAEDPERIARIEREAKAVAKLEHPNILAIYDFGTDEGVTYSVTELLEGETLCERLEGGAPGWRKARLEGGAPGWRKAAEIGAFIADGLAAAHEAGIIHRDLKPDNVFLTSDGRVKILDFGLARDIAAAASDETHSPTVSRYTDPGAVMGTAGYMSPEQVRGEPADHHADIFSLGCVLYELVCGTRAFSRDTAAETMTAILKEEPSDLSFLADDLPPSMANIVRRCLEKRPEARFQNVQDLAFALRSVLQDEFSPIALATSEEKSIVVLPFENISPDPEQEYFCDGMTEEIITDLSKIGSLRVISRNSAMKLKGTQTDTQAIGRQLRVQYVLEGSVRKAANSLRITAQLIDAEKDTHLWAEKYSGTLDDVFGIQEAVSRSIVEALKVTMTPEENERIAERPIHNVQVYECYLKSREEYWKWSEEGLERALQLIQTGLKVLGEDELFHVGLGTIYAQYIHFGIRKDESYLRKAEDCVAKVLASNPGSSPGHYLKGFTQWWRGKPKEAVRELRKALAIDPSDSDTMTWLAWIYAISGKGFAARPLFRKAIQVDPLNFSVYGHLSGCELLEGRLDRALDACETAYQMDRTNPWARCWYAFLHAHNHRFDDAEKYIDLLTGDSPQNIWAQLGSFLKHASRGDKTNALASVTEELRTATRWNEFYPLLMADCYAMIEEKEEAINWLEEASKWGCINYPFLNEHDPFLENIRGEERFAKLLARVKREWETFEV
jgi:serine/threonine protein kinase